MRLHSFPTRRSSDLVIAQRIVEFREKNGPYKAVDDLLKVQGIGEKSLTRIREKLVVGKPRK